VSRLATDPALVGRKVVLRWSGREIVATITRLESSYPKSAYTVVWTQCDNPAETDIPADCAGLESVAHCGQVVRVEVAP